MSSQRSVTLLLAGKPTVEGAGVRLHRVFGHPEVPRFDPFLLLDDFGSEDPDDYVAGFPWHPHRGIETVTYMLSGTVAHGDSLGNSGSIGAGEVQWMTAGRGIVHQEMPQVGDESLRGLQLWINLPAAHKMTTPLYRDITADDIPRASPAPGVGVRVLAGVAAGTRGPVTDHAVDPLYLDLTLDEGAEIDQPTPTGHTTFAYVIAGTGRAGAPSPYELRSGQLALFGHGDAVHLAAGRGGMRVLLVAGRPVGEPIVWSGPIVMNTREEIAAAYRELREGTFLREEGE